MADASAQSTSNTTDIAIVGMSVRVPGAANVADFWRMLHDGDRAIRRLTDAELSENGEQPARRARPDYAPFAAPLDGYRAFDPEFFGFPPKEAAILDPQHRQFLEVSWEALENAGHVPETFGGSIGVYAGCGMGSYFYFNLCSNPDLVDQTGLFLLRHTGNDKDFLSTRLSHVLDLRGPSINIQTACSTSLVATHFAAQALLNGECDMALAGGVTIELPQGRGYIFKEGEILSPDGECHAFDHRAQGTVFGSGVGVVALRRLEDAIADGDHIWAVIKGSAINNDGAAKAGYLAPSVEGQAEAIAEAQAMAGITADAVDYVECHGTGTYLGDPIEVSALTQAFRETTDRKTYCRIGSVKTNIGHLDTAAGVASLVKATLALHHEAMPPSLGYEAPNPAIDFETSPFRVNDRLTPWPRHSKPRLAGVNSLGVGGTNAHVVLEEAPETGPSAASDWPMHILTVSGRTKPAMQANANALAAHLRANPQLELADVAYTLQNGRRHFEHRLVTVAHDPVEAAELLETADPRRVIAHTAPETPPEVVFMFPGGGAQYATMARGLYETEPVFADWMDRGLDHLATLSDIDIRALWLPEKPAETAANDALKTPSLQLPLTMIVEYALAQLWMSWGVRPKALIGHSMGENTAAAVAGVMRFEDCIALVHTRGVLFDGVTAGGMVSVGLSAEALSEILPETLDIAAVNAPDVTVVSGATSKLDRFTSELDARGVTYQSIGIDIAAHSRLLDPILAPFRKHASGMSLSPPQIPIWSNKTGAILEDAEATDPEYWVSHLRGTVQFFGGIDALARTSKPMVFVEVGPGATLSALTRMHPDVPADRVIGSLRHNADDIDDDLFFLLSLGRLSALDVAIDWDQIWTDVPRRRLPLPTYAFQHKEFFIEPGKPAQTPSDLGVTRHDAIEDWGTRRVWVPKAAACEVDVERDLATIAPETWLVFEDDAGLGPDVSGQLEAAGHAVIRVRPGDRFYRDETGGYTISPERGREEYDLLIQDIVLRGLVPTRIAHFWLVTEDQSHRPGSSFYHRIQEQGFYALLYLTQALESEGVADVTMTVVTNGAARVGSEHLIDPLKATITGPARVIPRELPGIQVGVMDVALPDQVEERGLFSRRVSRDFGPLTIAVLEDMFAPPRNYWAALRGHRRYELETRPIALGTRDTPMVRPGGCYLITGGLGGIGLSLASRLVAEGAQHIALVGRDPLPAPDDRSRFLRDHGPNHRVSRRIAAVEALEAQGAHVHVFSADVTDIAEMRHVVEKLEETSGPIHGVIHAAGVINDGPLLSKRHREIEDLFAPKIQGAQVLEALFPDGVLDWMVLFASTSTVIAPAGQVDYVAANAYLNAFAEARADGKTRVLALNWGIWADVGMAADALSSPETAQHGTPPEPVDQPLLDVAFFDAQHRKTFETTLDPATHWVLNEHRIRAGNTAVMPGTGYIELVAEALAAHGEPGGFEIENLVFLRPLQAARPTQIRLRLERVSTGYDVTILSSVQLDGRTGWQVHATAIARRLDTPAAQCDFEALAARLALPSAAPNALRSAQEDHLAFGPKWQVLRGVTLGQNEGLARLSLSDKAGADGMRLHPALLDIATGWAMELIDGYDPAALWVPVKYDQLRAWRALPAEVLSSVRSIASDDPLTARFDIDILTLEGEICVTVRGFEIRQVDRSFGFVKAPQTPEADIQFDTPATPPLSPGEERQRQNLAQGIRSDEGAEAFMRALARKEPQIVVSSLDLDALVRQAETTNLPAAPSNSFDRPDLDNTFAAPETEIERTLSEFWSELLGISQVGIDDSFFDLGGHSLIAVRLFSMIGKTFGVNFPISVLFEAPTIRSCAALIEDRTDTTGAVTRAEPGDEDMQDFRYLVPMHAGEPGGKAPFFLVAGMFGNVLNLRHLAQLLGSERPFYGLQARGLYGDEAPHETIEAAASDYIVEMRAVQPHGPYHIGGFSGGGITAYEVARQLAAAGEEVAIVILLDTPLPQRRALTWPDRLRIQAQEFQRHGPLYPLAWARRRIHWEVARRWGKSAAGEEVEGFHNARIEAAFLGAVAAYEIAPWSGNLVLFRPPLIGHWTLPDGRLVNSERAYMLHDNDWGQYAPGLTVCEVTGDHDSMVLEPHVRGLANAMRNALELADTSPPENLPAEAAE